MSQLFLGAALLRLSIVDGLVQDWQPSDPRAGQADAVTTADCPRAAVNHKAKLRRRFCS
jgi:hypothetical protein